VVSRNSTFAYKGKAMDAHAVGRELNVRYVLEGSVRKAGDRVRMTAQLGPSSSGPCASTASSPTSSRCRTRSLPMWLLRSMSSSSRASRPGVWRGGTKIYEA
jgi:hypothetical protein